MSEEEKLGKIWITSSTRARKIHFLVHGRSITGGEASEMMNRYAKERINVHGKKRRKNQKYHSHNESN